jgi:DNA primase
MLADLPVSDRLSLRLRPAFKYLTKRGATDWHIERFQIGYCPSGEFAHYLIFPIVQGNRQVYFTSRYCGDSSLVMKSKNLPNAEGFFTRADCLLNFDSCRGVERIALVEGPFDMMAYEHAVGSMGSHVSPRQIDLFRLLVDEGLREVVVSQDPGAGKPMYAAYRALLPIVPEVSVLALDAGDPWSRRADLPRLLEGRRAPDTATLVKQRMGRNK